MHPALWDGEHPAAARSARVLAKAPPWTAARPVAFVPWSFPPLLARRSMKIDLLTCHKSTCLVDEDELSSLDEDSDEDM